MCVHDMSKMIQIRNVPDSLHRELKARAAMHGMSLSDYLLFEIRRSAGDRLKRRKPIAPSVSPAEAVREERDQQ
jgi:hypothetical protein